MALYDETARWYDAAHDALVDHAADITALRALFATHATRDVRRVLDLGCGTGTHAILLDHAGFDVDALDASSGQLTVARAKADRAGARVRLHHADMAKPLPAGEWDATISLNASFTYLVDDDVAARVLARLVERVPPGGLLVIDAWEAERVEPAKTFDRHVADDGAEVLRLVERAVAGGRVYLAVETMVLHEGRVVDRARESHRMRARTQPEMRALLAENGWEVRDRRERAKGRAWVTARRG